MAPTAELAFNIAHANKSSVRSDWNSINISKVELPSSASCESIIEVDRWKKLCFSSSLNTLSCNKSYCQQATQSFTK